MQSRLVRLATDSEWLGAELIRVLSADAKQHVERTGQRGFVDATREEGPGEDSEPDAAPAPEAGPGGRGSTCFNSGRRRDGSGQ